MIVEVETVIFRLMAILLALWSVSAFSGEIGVKQKAEIDHLFSFIDASPCEFSRNGKWYTAAKAGDHIKTKYQYLLVKGMIGSAEEFIELAATKSSVSGKYYLVKCGSSTEIRSEDWLKQELSSFRSVQQ